MAFCSASLFRCAAFAFLSVSLLTHAFELSSIALPIRYLIEIGRLDDAAVKLAEVVNAEKFASKKGRTNHQLWQWLCELITKNPGSVTSLRVDPIIRGGLRRFTDMKGTLWCALADYYIRQGNFEKARDV